jgi:hypothetical protein
MHTNLGLLLLDPAVAMYLQEVMSAELERLEALFADAKAQQVGKQAWAWAQLPKYHGAVHQLP